MPQDFNMRVGVTAEVDKSKIQAQITKETKNIDINVNVKVDKAEAQKAVQKVFDKDKLDKQGREYFTKTTGILKQVKDYYKKNGAISIDISNQQKANGQIKSFTATVTEATGVIKKFNYERGKINTGGTKANYGFVQTDNVGVLDKLSGTKLKQTDDFLSKIQTRISDINSKTFNQSKPLLSVENSDKYNTVLTNTQDRITSITKSTKILSDDHKREIGTMIADLDRYRKELQNVEYAGTKLKPDTFTDTKSILQSQLGTNIQKWDSSNIFDGNFKKNVLDAKSLLDNATNPEGIDKYRAKLKLLNEDFKQIKQSSKDQQSLLNLESGKTQLTNRLSSYLKDNSKLSVDLKNRLIELQKQVQFVDNKSDLNKLKNSFREVTTEAVALGKTGDNAFTKLSKNASQFLSYLGSATIIMSAINSLREVATNVIGIDSAMTDLRKVSDATDNEFNSFLVKATQNAKTLGASITDVVSATADFARLGYGLPDATELARVATLYKNVGDISVSDASTSLISTMKAFGYGANEAERIVDIFNEVGNRFAISSAGIGDSLQNSAAALMTANNTLEQSTALTVGANNVLQDPSAVGVLWKTVSMRIRGASSELEEAGLETDGILTSTSKLQSKIKDLTGGFDIMLDKDTFKSTYDIIVGIGDEWSKLSDIKQAELLEILAGKRQGTGLASALTNVEDIKNAFDTATKSAGSAATEQEKYEKSIQYSLDKMTASTQAFSKSFLNSSLVKGVVDLGTVGVDAITDLTDALGGLGLVIASIVTYKGIKSGIFDFAKLSSNISLLITNQEALAVANGIQITSWEALTASISSALGASTAFMLANPIVLMASAAVSSLALIGGALDAMTTSTEEARDEAKKSADELASLQSEISDINTELKTTQDRIDEILAKDKLTLTDEQELENLKAQNDELERELRIKEKLEVNAKKQASDDATQVFTSAPDNGVFATRGTKDFSETMYSDGQFSAASGVSATYDTDRNRLDATLTYMEQIKSVSAEILSLNKQHDKLDENSADYKLLTSQIENKKLLLDSIQKELDKNIEDFQTEDDSLVSGLSEETDFILATLSTIYSKYDNLTNDINTETIELNDRLLEKFTGGSDSKNNIATWVDGLSEEDKKALITLDFDENDTLATLKQRLADLQKAAEEEPISLLFDTDTFATVTKGLGDIQSLYSEFAEGLKENKKFTPFDISEVNALKETFGELGNAWDNFESTLTTSGSNAKDVQSAFDSLSTAYLTSSTYLDGLTTANREQIVTQLELKGISNASSIVTKELAEASEFLATKGRTLSTVTLEEVNAFVEEKGVSEDVRISLINFTLAKEAANDITLATDGDIANIISLMEACENGASALKKFQEYKQGLFDTSSSTYISAEDIAKASSGTLEGDAFGKQLEEKMKSQGGKLSKLGADAEKEIQGYINKANQKATVKNTSSSSKDKNKSSGSKDSKEEIDWIARKLEVLSKALDVIKAKASDTFSKFSDRLKSVDKAISKVNSQIKVYQKSYDSYMSAANGVGLSASLKSKVQNGSYDITEYSSEIASKIKSYQEYYDAAQDAKDKITELKATEKEYAEQKIDLIQSKFASKTGFVDSTISLREAKIGDNGTTKDYTYLATQQKKNLAYKQDEYKEVKEQFDAMVNSGQIEEYTQKWFDYREMLVGIKTEIEDAKDSTNEYINLAANAKFTAFEKLLETLTNVEDSISHVSSLLSGDSFSGKNMTSTGLTQQYLNLQGLANAKTEILEYQSALSKLNRSDFSSGEKGLATYNEKLEELTSGLHSAQSSVKSYRDAIVDLIKQGIEAETDAMRDYVDVQKEALESEKALNDYKKSIEEKSSNIATLQRKINELKQSSDRKDIALRLELEKDLADAEKDLQETKEDHNLEVKESALDDELSAYEKTQDDKLKMLNNNLTYQENAISNSLAQIKGNYSSIYAEINELSKTYGESIKDNIVSPTTKALANLQTSLTGDVSKTASVVSGVGSSATMGGATNIKDAMINGILHNGTGTGNATDTLTKYLTSHGYTALSRSEMVSLASALGLSGIKDVSDVAGNDSANREKILKALKKAGFKNGGIGTGYSSGSLQGLIKQAGEDQIGLFRNGEGFVAPEHVPYIKDLLNVIPTVDSLLTSPNFTNLVSSPNRSQVNLEITSPLITVSGVARDDINAQIYTAMEKVPDIVGNAIYSQLK